MEKELGFKGKVCVTGASGYLASWLIKRLLLSGYHVIGTVRDPGNNEKVGHLWELEGAKERLKLVKANLMVEGSFDDAIMGCDGVFHTASPVLGPKSDPKAEILDPAINGTLNVLRSCKKNKFLKRVVLTSSSSTVRVKDDFDRKVPLDESSWASEEFCKKIKFWYALSKTLAEKAAWEFAKENQIDLVTVLPAFVIGPSLPPELCSTASDVLGLLKGETERFKWHGRMGYVHIDDVAECHILVYEDSIAQGRYLCCSQIIGNNDLVSLLGNRYPSLPIPKSRAVSTERTILSPFTKEYRVLVALNGIRLFLEGSLLFEELGGQDYDFNTSKIRSLGMKFKGIEEMFDDCIASLKEQGHLAI